MSTKLGVHVNIGPRGGFGPLCAAAPAMVVAVEEGGALLEAKEKSGGRTITIFRDLSVYGDGPPGIDHMTEAGAVTAADLFWPRLRERYDLNPADYYQVTNEVGGDNEQTLENLAVFECRLMDLAERDGYRLVVGNAAGGSPASWDLWLKYFVPLIRRSGEGGHLYGRHAYGGVVMGSNGLLTQVGPAPADDNAARPFREATYLREAGVKTPLVITEAGPHGGMRFPGTETLLEDVARYDGLCGRHDNIWGFCLWTFGDFGPFPANIQPAAAELAAYVTRAGGGQPRAHWSSRSLVAPARPANTGEEPPAVDPDDARFLRFSSDQDLNAVPAGSQVSATWRLRNTGETAWRKGYHVVHVDPGLISDRRRIPLSEATGQETVIPGQEVDVRLHMRAPETSGEAYRSVWQLQDRQGEYFGPRIWLRAVVVEGRGEGRAAPGKRPGRARLATGMNINPDVAHGNPLKSEVLRGLDWVRWPFKAADKQRSIADSFAEYDAIVRGYARLGVGSLIVLNQQTVGGAGAPWKSGSGWFRYASQLAATARWIGERYADLGDGVAFEIWNEGDNPNTPHVSVYVPPESFAIVLNKVSAALRRSAPRAKIVLGGLSTGPKEAVAYVNKVRQALDGRLPVDAIGIHPYGRWPRKRPFPDWGYGSLADALGIYREELPEWPLWITEIGIPGRKQPLARDKLPAVAAYMADLYELAAEHTDRLETVIWYAWADTMENAGIVDDQGRPKGELFEVFRKVRDRNWE